MDTTNKKTAEQLAFTELWHYALGITEPWDTEPWDPDAAYSRRTGQGYLVQMMETYGQDGPAVNPITHVAGAPACAEAVEPALADVAAGEAGRVTA